MERKTERRKKDEGTEEEESRIRYAGALTKHTQTLGITPEDSKANTTRFNKTPTLVSLSGCKHDTTSKTLCRAGARFNCTSRGDMLNVMYIIRIMISPTLKIGLATYETVQHP